MGDLTDEGVEGVKVLDSENANISVSTVESSTLR